MAASAVATARARVETPPVKQQAPKQQPALSNDAAASDAAIGAQVSKEGPAEARIRARVRLEHEGNAAAKAVEQAPADDAKAKARPGAGAAKPDAGPALTRRDREVTKLADRADRVFAQLVKQRDIIRDAVEFGDKGAAAQAFGRARELFAKLVAIGNEAQINQSSSTDSAALTDAKERISHRVRYGYEWAALIEEAMPGDQSL